MPVFPSQGGSKNTWGTELRNFFAPLFDLATGARVAGQIVSADIADGTIVDADIAAGAGISQSKLVDIVDADIAVGAAISQSKLVDIVDADIAAGAAIVDTKLATIATANKVSDTSLNIPNVKFMSTYADFATAVSTIGATVTTLIVSEVEVVAANVTVPVTLTLDLRGAGRLSPNATKKITIASSTKNYPLRQVFSGAGTIEFSGSSVEALYPQWWGAVGDGIADDITAITAMWVSALAGGHDIQFTTGTWLAVEANFPFRQGGTPVSLQDGKNITIFGSGPDCILKTSSVGGADVLQTNGMKNLHFRNLGIRGAISGSASGSNGISVTNGWDNLSFMDIYIEDMPFLDKGAFLDGGSGLSIQPATTVNECGTLKGRVFVKGCTNGIDLSPDLVTHITKKSAIEIDYVVEDCYQSVVFSAGAATGPIPAGSTMGFKVSGQVINGQHAVNIIRAHGVEVEANIISTKTAAQKRLAPGGGAWKAADTLVDSLVCIYAHDSRISVYGNSGLCDHKVRIGGTTAGSSGLFGATDDCQIYIDLGGTAAISDILEVDSGGNTLRNSRVYVSTTTTSGALPVGFSANSRNNTITKGPQHTFNDTLIVDRIKAIQGNAIGSPEFALSAGWGASSTITPIFGNDMRNEFTINSLGAGQAANPTITFTFKDGTFTTIPFAIVVRNPIAGDEQPTADTISWVRTATTLTITWHHTPVVNDTITFAIFLMG